MKKLILSLAMIVSAQLVFSQTLKDGLALLDNDNIPGARKSFFAALKMDPKNAGAWYYLGQIHYSDDNLDSAAWYFNKAREMNPDSYYSHIGLGTMQLDKNLPIEAEKSFTKAKRSVKEKELPVVLGLLGNAYLKVRKPNYDKAAAAFKEARDMDSKTAKYFIGYGDALLGMGKIGDALASYEIASNKEKDNPEILMKIAVTYSKSGIPEVAIEQLESLLKKFPEYAPAYKELYPLYIQKGQYSKVTPLLDKYVSLVGNEVEQRARLVKFLAFQAKDYKRSIEEAKIVLQQDSTNYTMHRWLAWSYFESGEFQPSFDASKKLFETVGTRPVYTSDYEYYAKAASKLANPLVAIENYKKIMELDTSRTDIYDLVAKSYYDSKNFPEAEVAYKEKIDKGKPNSLDYYYLGMSRYQQGKYMEADSALAKLVELQPVYATGWLYRAKALSKLDPDRTTFGWKPFYEKYIELAAADPEKNKRNLIEAYNLVGYYYSQHDDNVSALSNYEKSLALDPTEATNAEAFGAVPQLKEILGGK